MISVYPGVDNLELMKEAANYNKFLVSMIKKAIRPCDVIVDFGAGVGTFADRLMEDGLNVHCIEPDDRLRQLLSSKGHKLFKNLNEVSDNSFDYLYALNVLEHIENDNDVVRSWHLKLKKGGRLMVFVPAFSVLFSSMDQKVGHYRRYRLKQLKTILEDNFFEVLSGRYVDSLGFFVSLIFKLLGNDSGDLNQTALLVYDRLIFPLSRALDSIFYKILGKNIVIYAKKR